MSNMDATRVMGAALPGAGATATVQMPAGGDAFRTQMGGTTTCPVCKSTTPLLDSYCGDCGYLLSSTAVEEVSMPIEEAPPAELLDEQTSRRYRLHLGVNTVGRQGTDILATEGTVSRNHATVTVSDTGIFVEDLGSSNGTKVGDVRLQANSPVAASSGEIVRFGTWKLALQVGSAAASAAEPTVMSAANDKTVVLVDAPEEAGSSSEDMNTEPAASVEQAQTIAILKKMEGICDDIRIPEGMMSLGRKSGNALVLADPYLSGRHAEIFADPSGVYLVDVGSTNGTLVNGQKLEANDRQLLLDGDEVQLGQTRYQFMTLSEVDRDSTGSDPQPEGAEHAASLDQNDDEAAESGPV